WLCRIWNSKRRQKTFFSSPLGVKRRRAVRARFGGWEEISPGNPGEQARGSALLRGQFGDQTERDRQAFKLVVRTQVELRGIVAGVALDLLDHDFRRCERAFGLFGFGRGFRTEVDVLVDPGLQPVLHLVAALVRA